MNKKLKYNRFIIAFSIMFIGMLLIIACGGGGGSGDNSSSNSPTVLITSPQNRSAFEEGGKIIFTGDFRDPEDGIRPSGISWVSSIQGNLNNQSLSFSTNELAIGTHKITLTCIDSDGLSSSATLTVTVGGIYGGESGEVVYSDTNSDGISTITSNTLGAQYSIEVLDNNGNVVPNISIDYCEIDGSSMFHIFDPSGRYTSAFIYAQPGDLSSFENAIVTSYDKVYSYNNEQKPAVLLFIGLVVTVASIAAAEVSFIFNAYDVATFYVSDAVAEGDGWTMYCKDWTQIADLILSRTGMFLDTTSIFISYATAGVGSTTTVSITSDILGYGANTLRDFLLEQAIRSWGLTMAELEGKPVAVKVNLVDESAYARNFRQLFAEYQIIRDHSICESPEGDVSGTVIDATTGDPISGVVVEMSGPAYSQVTTGSDGRYSFGSGIIEGDYTITASKNGYITSEKVISVTSGVQNVVNFVLSQTLSSNEYRIVLEWGQNPSDLDSHLWTPNIEGSNYHVYYANRGSENSAPYAELDIDDTTSYGPETITIFNSYSGTYTYSVYDYTTSNTLSTSNGNVKLYGSNGLINEWNVPASGSGNWWNIFELDALNGQITSINTISSNPPN